VRRPRWGEVWGGVSPSPLKMVWEGAVSPVRIFFLQFFKVKRNSTIAEKRRNAFVEYAVARLTLTWTAAD